MKLIPSDDPRLRMVCEPVVPGEPIQNILDAMKRACHRNYGGFTGVGIAAPQIGVMKQIIYINYPLIANPFFMLNPKLTAVSDRMVTEKESCLSFPGVSVEIARAEWIRVQYLDIRRSAQDIGLNTYVARIVQHEIDHINGKNITDYEVK